MVWIDLYWIKTFFRGVKHLPFFGFLKEIQTAKEEFNERQSLRQSPVEHKPSRIDTSDKGTLIKCQVIITEYYVSITFFLVSG